MFGSTTMSLNRNISYFSNGSMLQPMCFLLQKIFVIDFKVTIMGSQNSSFPFSLSEKFYRWLFQTPQIMEIILLLFFSGIMIVNLSLNVLVVLAVTRFKRKQPPINYLFLNLALSDMLVATSLIPQYIIRPVFMLPDGWAGTLLCKLFVGGFTIWVAGCASTTIHVVIALERFYATRLGNLARKLQGRKLKMAIALVWIYAVLTEIPPFCVMTYDKSRKSCFEKWPNQLHGKIYTVFTFLVDFAVPLIFMAALYSKTVMVLWVDHSKGSNTSLSAVKTRKRVTKISIIVTVLHALCWFPDVTSYLLVYHVPGLVEYGSILYHACVIPVAVGTCLNPIVYALQSSKFRMQMKNMVCCFNVMNSKKVFV